MTSELNVSEVTRIAREAADRHSLPLEVMGVTLPTGGSDYVEILVSIDNCASPPCQIAVGVFRNLSESALSDEIVSRLRHHVEKQRRSGRRQRSQDNAQDGPQSGPSGATDKPMEREKKFEDEGGAQPQGREADDLPTTRRDSQ